MASEPAIPQQHQQRVMSFPLPLPLYHHVQFQARRFGVSRAGYVRMLVARDLEANQQQAG